MIKQYRDFLNYCIIIDLYTIHFELNDYLYLVLSGVVVTSMCFITHSTEYYKYLYRYFFISLHLIICIYTLSLKTNISFLEIFSLFLLKYKISTSLHYQDKLRWLTSTFHFQLPLRKINIEQLIYVLISLPDLCFVQSNWNYIS